MINKLFDRFFREKISTFFAISIETRTKNVEETTTKMYL